MDLESIKSHLLNQEVVVMPTDTVYGLVALASSKTAVEQIFKLKYRQADKPPTIVIGNLGQLSDLKINTVNNLPEINKYWPGPISLIMRCPAEELAYLHRHKFSLAVRLPKLAWLAELSSQVGPLATSSANQEGQSVATTIGEATNYFNDQIELYVDGGKLPQKASKIIDLTSSPAKIIRK